MAFQCSLDSSMLQTMASYDGLHYFYYYQQLQAILFFYLGMDGLTYAFFDGQIMYEYSFLVALDLLSPMTHSIFSFGHMYLMLWSFHHPIADWRVGDSHRLFWFS